MKLKLRYFASLRESLGAEQSLDVEAGLTLGGLRDLLIESDALHAQALARGRALRVALNQSLSDESARLSEGDEVAFFPPVTGG